MMVARCAGCRTGKIESIRTWENGITTKWEAYPCRGLNGTVVAVRFDQCNVAYHRRMRKLLEGQSKLEGVQESGGN